MTFPCFLSCAAEFDLSALIWTFPRNVILLCSDVLYAMSPFFMAIYARREEFSCSLTHGKLRLNNSQ
jgi:hypothetical protein